MPALIRSTFGIPIPPDGRRAEVLNLGPILNIDLPEFIASVKIKALTTVLARNTVRSSGVAVGWIRKLN